jgi:hypothetical protein
MQISEQHCGARPPGCETDHGSDAGVQVILECTETDRRNRNHAHGEEGAVALPRLSTHVCSATVLQPGILISEGKSDSFDAFNVIATEPEKAIVYNELVTNAVALQTVVDQTQALHTLRSKGVNIRTSDLAFLSPYATSKLKRFGDYPTDMKPEAMPTRTTLPL